MASAHSNGTVKYIKFVGGNKIQVINVKPQECLSNIPSVKCSLLNSDNIFLGKNKASEIMCLSDGNVLEVIGEDVVTRCMTKCLNPSEIKVFYRYYPSTTYYLIKDDTNLVVLEKKTFCLEEFVTYEQLHKFEIDDVLGIGKPQVLIWCHNEKEPIITDFSNDVKNVNCKSQQISQLNQQLRMIQSSKREMNRIAEARELICKNSFEQISDDSSFLTFSEIPWQKVYDNLWIICVPVTNTSEQTLNIGHFIVKNEYTNEIETRVANFKFLSNEKLFLKNEILPSGCVYVIGIVKFPNFDRCDSVTLKCSLLYSVSGDVDSDKKELEIPPFHLLIGDLLTNNVGFCDSDMNSLKQYVVITTAISEFSKKFELHLKQNKSASQFIDTVVNKFQFVRVELLGGILESTKCFCVQSKSSLSGSIVFAEKVSDNVVSVICYSKNPGNITMFKNLLRTSFENELQSICQGESLGRGMLAAVNTLTQEFDYFTSELQTAMPAPSLPIKNKNDLNFSVETWKGLRESVVQLDTERHFANVLKEIHNVQ